MKMVVQRVKEASVTADNCVIGQIKQGYMVLLGVNNTDTVEIAEKMVRKLLNLRIFEDADGKTNLDIKSVDGELLIISQFTLYADCRKGNRPSFVRAGEPAHAKKIYEYVIQKCREEMNHVAHGEFGAHMEVSLINNGPFTVVLDSDEIIK